MKYILRCLACGEKYNNCEKSIYRCEKCGGSMEIIYDYDELIPKINTKILEKREPGVWKYKELLPLNDHSKIVALGEGGTKLHKCKRLAEVLALEELYAKDETRNPTGTFKDRPATVGVSKALELGATSVAIASDGNAGPATAAYAAKAGLKCYVFMPATTPMDRIVQVQMFGGKVILVKGTVSDCIDILTKVQDRYDWHQLTTAIPSNPYQAEGSKTIAYEICEDLGWSVPNWVVMPVGGGGLLTANWKGFKEFFKLGIIKKLPKIAAIQAKGCAPVVKAYGEDKNEVESWEEPNSIAITIGVPYPLDGTTALKAIRESKGIAMAVSDKEILEAERLLAQTEGIFAEPAGVASLAGVKKLIEKEIIGNKEKVVFEVTGTGLKDFKSAMKMHEKPPCIKAEPKEVKTAIEFYRSNY